MRVESTGVGSGAQSSGYLTEELGVCPTRLLYRRSGLLPDLRGSLEGFPTLIVLEVRLRKSVKVITDKKFYKTLVAHS